MEENYERLLNNPGGCPLHQLKLKIVVPIIAFSVNGNN